MFSSIDDSSVVVRFGSKAGSVDRDQVAVEVVRVHLEAGVRGAILILGGC